MVWDAWEIDNCLIIWRLIKFRYIGRTKIFHLKSGKSTKTQKLSTKTNPKNMDQIKIYKKCKQGNVQP